MFKSSLDEIHDFFNTPYIGSHHHGGAGDGGSDSDCKFTTSSSGGVGNAGNLGVGLGDSSSPLNSRSGDVNGDSN